MSEPTWIVTGGSGFIGSAFVLLARSRGWAQIINLDLLTYAGNQENLAGLAADPGYRFVHGDICDAALVARLLAEHRPAAVVNFAAESHVDRSIHDAAPFLRTNVLGTQVLLDAARAHLAGLDGAARAAFRFLHVSTDEVYGTLGPGDAPFTERTPYAPNSPYAASKAAADHLVRAARHTHGLPTLVTNCSNNYGPRQFPEKLIPLVICNAREGRPLPVYGDGLQVRDWLHVEDHCEAIALVLGAARPGETYNVGGGNEQTNIHIVRTICRVLDELEPAAAPREGLIRFVADRPGHDRRYAIDAAKIRADLGWSPRVRFEDGLRDTVRWYLANSGWVDRVRSGAYRDWLDVNYANRKEAAP
jgi:dTDP-glucose 4,6-dehydratase